MKLSDLTSDPNNANRGTERGNKVLETSLQTYGAGRSILLDKNDVIIAGNKTAEVAGQIGMENVVVVETTGDSIVAVKRTDLDLTSDPEARELAYADNRVGQISLEWDPAVLLEASEAGTLPDFWSNAELKKIIGDADPSAYSQKVDTPTYEPSDKKPGVEELFDDNVLQALLADIRASNIPEEEKQLLTLAAGRHVKLNFEKLADYYAHSEPETQELMEDNALVIVDFEKAIENGWVKLSDAMIEQYGEENDDA